MRKLTLIFVVAFILRVFLSTIAYHGDLNNNISWGTRAVHQGLVNFYEGEKWPYSAPNQPPLTILLFAGVILVWQWLDKAIWWLNDNLPLFYSPFIWWWESHGMALLVKLPSILADLGIAFIIYLYMKGRKKEDLGLKLGAIWLFNPISWYNSAIWGQTDALVNFLGLTAVLLLLKKKLTPFIVILTMSLLFKGSLSIFIPILGFIALWQRHSVGQWARAIAASLLTVILISVWFHPALNVIPWLVNLYQTRILPGEIGFLTANAFNFWWLVDPGRTLDSVVYFGLSARIWGLTITLVSIALISKWLYKKVDDKRIFYALALIAFLVFLFMTRIHERYLYPFFPSATILIGLIPGFMLPYIVLSTSHILNLYHLFWAPPIAPLEALYKTVWFANLLSIVNLASLFWLLRFAKRI